MFDANMRSLEKGKWFFSHIYGLEKNSPLYGTGVNVDDIVISRMLDENDDTPRVSFRTPSGYVVIQHDDEMLHTHACFEGYLDLNGFINIASKNKAEQVLRTLSDNEKSELGIN